MRIGVKFSPVTTYNREENDKVERGHNLIVKTPVKVCEGKVRELPQLLPYSLWGEQTTHNNVSRFMPFKLIYWQTPIMTIEYL